MAKKKVEKPKRELTKRQLSHWQQQRRRQHIVLWVGVLVVVAALALIGAGWYFSYYQPLHQVVIRVDNTRFDMDYYIKMLKLYGKGQTSQYLDSLASSLVTLIERNELIRKGALSLGISVSDSEINEKLKSYDPPLGKDYRDIARTELLVDKLLSRYFGPKVPASAAQVHMMALFLESESQAAEVRARLEAGEDFGQLAAELSLDSFSQKEKGDLGWHPEDALTGLLLTSVPGKYAFNAELGVLSQPVYDGTKTKAVGYWLVKVLAKQPETEQIQVQAMLLGSEEEAQAVSARLEAGEDFGSLASGLSQDETSRGSGGNFGWISREEVLPGADFAAWASAFGLETGATSGPIRDTTVTTTGGYWLVRVLEREDDRAISVDDQALLSAMAFDTWVLTLRDSYSNKIESYLTDELKQWALAKVSGG